jgi:enterochelin esterase family protein
MAAGSIVWGVAGVVQAQAPVPVVSPEVGADRRVTFRLLAPEAEAVRLSGGDIPGVGQGLAMTKRENGVWEVTTAPLEPGAYRYLFSVSGVGVVDPRSPATSESNTMVWSLVMVPGAPLTDTRAVPHGALASLPYYSQSLSKWRRLHVYTPPGYETGKDRYPVFYLLHGASDSDHSWSSVGRAGIILDNLLADGKIKPMVVVMPAGHTRAFGGPPPGTPPRDEFGEDFVRDIVPTIERRYRVYTDRSHRAIAGLSMGGSQSLDLLLGNPQLFGYVGVFSSGLLGAFRNRPAGAPAPTGPTWEDQHKAQLDDPRARKGLKLLWLSTGTDDFLLQASRSTVDLLKRHGFTPIYEETGGGHTWTNWRAYLGVFAPKLFR